MGAADKPLRLIGYCRVSTEEQAQDGVSLAAQRAQIGAYCAMRNYNLVDVVVEDGSGKDLDGRPLLRAALERVRTKQADGIVAAKLDRLTRSVRDAIDLADDAKKRGWTLVSVEETLDTSTPLGNFFLHIMAAFAELERRVIVDRTKKAMAHLKASGKRAGQIPYGMRLIPGVPGGALEPDPEEQAIILRIVEASARGVVPGCIADDLNAAHVPARGERWHRTTIRRILAAAQNGGSTP